MNIIVFTGKKGSGKNTMANYVAGEVLVANNVIDKYEVDDKGQLLVPTSISGDVEMHPLDLSRQDKFFKEHAPKYIWPNVKLYSFADPLKDICMNLLGLTYEQCYGTDEDKNSLTKITWESLPHYIRLKNAKKDKCPTGIMTAREVMQHVGTEIFRRMSNDCWVENCAKRVLTDNSKVAMICDCRFPNEVECLKKSGGKVIRLTRNTSNDKHESEVALDAPKYDQSNFDLILDNKSELSKDTFAKLKPKLVEWGVLS